MATEIVGWGTPEAAWQAWNGLDALPRLAASSLVEPGQRAVVVAPHPDDELLGVGGVLAQVSPHSPVLVVAVTDGEGSHPGSPAWTPERLKAVRPAETESALAAMGIAADVLRLGIADGGVGLAENAVVRALRQVLEPGDVVFSTWRGDGHPDHEAVGRAVRTACSGAAARHVEVPIWMWHWAEPADPRVPWSAAARVDLPAAVVDRKRAAVREYESQLAHDPVCDLGCILPGEVLDRLLRRFETVIRDPS